MRHNFNKMMNGLRCNDFSRFPWEDIFISCQMQLLTIVSNAEIFNDNNQDLNEIIEVEKIGNLSVKIKKNDEKKQITP